MVYVPDYDDAPRPAEGVGDTEDFRDLAEALVATVRNARAPEADARGGEHAHCFTHGVVPTTATATPYAHSGYCCKCGVVQGVHLDRLTQENAALRDRLAASEAECETLREVYRVACNSTVHLERQRVAAESALARTREALEEIRQELCKTWKPNPEVPDRDGVERILLAIQRIARRALAGKEKK